MIRHGIWGRPVGPIFTNFGLHHPADTSCSWPPFQRWYLMTFAIRMSLHLPVRKAKFEQVVVRSLSANPCNIVIADNYIIHKDFKHQQWKFTASNNHYWTNDYWSWVCPQIRDAIPFMVISMENMIRHDRFLGVFGFQTNPHVYTNEA